jgi:hypothetical protein
MLKIVRHNAKTGYEHQGVTFVQLDRWQNELLQDLASYDAILLQSNDPKENVKIIDRVRGHDNPNIYLLPIFSKYVLPPNLNLHTDGTFEEGSSKKVKTIQHRIESVTTITHSGFAEQTVQKTLNFIYSRQGSLNPIKIRTKSLGFDYPFIGLAFSEEPEKMISTLDQMAQSGILEGNLNHRIPLCGNCADSFLFFTETCPKCESIDIGAEDIIHHFPCAHVAPLSAFKQPDSDQLQCPKCHKGLRHIGIDYDKPSQMHGCHSCNHQFQEADMKAQCHSCGNSNPLAELREIELYDYKLTSKGLMAAESGLEQNKTDSLSQSHMVFEEIVRQEKRRKKPKGYHGYKLTLSLNGKVLEALNPQFVTHLWDEIAELCKSYTQSHLHILQTEHNIQLLLFDLPKNDFLEIQGKMKKNLNMLLTDNIGPGLEVYIAHEKIS